MGDTAIDDDKIIIKKEIFERLEKQAETDQLTGILNRRGGEAKVRELVSEGEDGAFLMLDMDHFKAANDTYGHVTGDEMLKTFAGILTACTRKDDVVYRYGGDEFCAFLKGCTDPEVISERCYELIDRTEQAMGRQLDDNLNHEFSVSVGVALCPEDGDDPEQLVINSDKALYAVKQSGGHGFYFYQGNYGSIKDLFNRSDAVSILKLRSMVEENGHPEGAYSVGSNDFRNIYRFLRRYCERSGTGVQLVVLTLKDVKIRTENSKEDASILEAERQLGEIIGNTLRRGDVTAQFGPNQFLVLLMDTDTEKGKIAVNRVMKNWEKQNPVFNLEFEIQNV